jgi:acyl carrier protein
LQLSDDIYQRLTPIFEDVFDEDDVTITAATTANDIAEWDSLRHIRLIIAVEKEFDIKFLTSEVNDFKNVGELVEKILAKAD